MEQILYYKHKILAMSLEDLYKLHEHLRSRTLRFMNIQEHEAIVNRLQIVEKEIDKRVIYDLPNKL